MRSRRVGAKTLFATHYHELSELEGHVEGVQNYCISVKEHGEDVIFLRKIVRGGADKELRHPCGPAGRSTTSGIGACP